MKHTTFIKAIAVASTVAAIAPTVSNADTGVAWVKSTNPNVLYVKSNGQSYTQLDFLGNFGVQAKLEFDTGTAGRIKSWWIEPEITNGYGIAAQVQGMAAYRQSQSYSVGNRPKSINKTINFAIPSGMIKNAAVGMCNWKANSLRNQGKSDKWIFDRNHDVHFEMDVRAGVDSNGAGSGSQIWEYSAPKNMTVRCMKWKGAQIPSASNDLKNPLGVSKATMKVKEVATLAGACLLDTTTAIVATEANATVKYRFVHSSGKKSKVFTTTTKGNKIAVVKHKWDIPNKPGPEQGWIQIEGTSPNFKSNQPRYKMNCKAKAAGGFATEPQKPKPANKLKTKPAKPKLKLRLNSNS